MISRQMNERRELEKIKIEHIVLILGFVTVFLIVFNIMEYVNIIRIYNVLEKADNELNCYEDNFTEQLVEKIKILQEQEYDLDITISQNIISEHSENMQTDSQDIHNGDNDDNNIKREVSLPSIPTNIKSFTDYRVYNIEGTPHYRLQNQCYTDQLGLRRFGEDYCVAVGSYYSTDIGDRFEVTLDTGFVFTVIVSDTKADYDTDEKHMYTPCVNYNGEDSGNLLEFIVDVESISKEMYAYGSVDYYSQFKGNIANMFYLGRDQSGDWTSYE